MLWIANRENSAAKFANFVYLCNLYHARKSLQLSSLKPLKLTWNLFIKNWQTKRNGKKCCSTMQAKLQVPQPIFLNILFLRQESLQVKQMPRVRISCLAMLRWQKRFPNCQRRLTGLTFRRHKVTLLSTIICKFCKCWSICNIPTQSCKKCSTFLRAKFPKFSNLPQNVVKSGFPNWRAEWIAIFSERRHDCWNRSSIFFCYVSV